jgi:hypothetical protein
MGECGDHFPHVHSGGDLKVSGGRGQGMLVVDGDLELVGGFVFAGVIVVRGRLRIGGIGTAVTGAVVVANEEQGLIAIGGTAVIRYSKCAIDRALAASGSPELLRSRSGFRVF